MWILWGAGAAVQELETIIMGKLQATDLISQLNYCHSVNKLSSEILFHLLFLKILSYIPQLLIILHD